MPNNMSMFSWMRPRETTAVSDETERKIPLRVWRDSCLLALFGVACLVGACYLGHLQYCKWGGTAAGWDRRALDFTRLNWPLLAILVILTWVGCTAILLYRFQVENVSKHGPPVMTVWPAEFGLWTPWRARRILKSLVGGDGSIRDRYAELFGSGDEDDLEDDLED